MLGGAVSAAIPSGSTLSITLVGTSDIALSGYQFVLINQGASNNGWTVASDYVSVASSVDAGGSVGIDLVVVTTGAVASGDYLKLCLQANNGAAQADAAPVLTIASVEIVF